MEPRIQYAKTSDGVSVAYYAMGHGTPIVLMILPNSHLQMEWQMSDVRQGYEAVAHLGTLVRYDHRGFGLSDRDVSDFSIEALLRDLQAVVDRLELKSFNLMAYSVSSPLAIAFAAAQPDRVLKLVLWPGLARLPETFTEPIGKLLAFDAPQWEFVTESLMRLGQGWSDEISGQAAAMFRESVTRDTLLEFWRQVNGLERDESAGSGCCSDAPHSGKGGQTDWSGCRARARYHDPRCPPGYPGRRVAPGEVGSSGAGNNSVPG